MKTKDRWRRRARRLLAASAACASLWPLWSGAADQFTGVPRVVDGDTLAFDGQRVRIRGIDAPESAQTCVRTGVEELCGAQAAAALGRMLAGREVTCASDERDDHGRPIAVCRVGTIDIGSWMVAAGQAVAFVKYRRDYVAIEASARQQHIGIWGTTFEMPWDYRHRMEAAAPSTAASTPPGDCKIKGNIGSKGDRVYHMPGQAFYETTAIDPKAGERWFCTAVEAEAAGWRPSKR